MSKKRQFLQWFSCLTLVLSSYAACAEDNPIYGAELEGFSYPWPVKHFEFRSQKQSLHMAYMDLQPDVYKGQAIVLLHGKNFCAATWEDTAKR